MALILVLGIVFLLSALVLESQMRVSTALQREQQALLQTRLRMAATDAIMDAIQRLADDDDTLAESLREEWNQPQEGVYPDGIATYTTTIDANRFFDLNNLAVEGFPTATRTPRDMLRDILYLCGTPRAEALTAALEAWVDGDQEGEYELPYYRAQGLDARPPDRPLLGAAELEKIAGWSRALFARNPLKEAARDLAEQAEEADCLTVVPSTDTQRRMTPININTASREVLLGVLGRDQEGLVQTALVMREFEPLRSLSVLTRRATPAVQKVVLAALSVRSHCFFITSRAYGEGRREDVFAVVARKEGGVFHIVQWVLQE